MKRIFAIIIALMLLVPCALADGELIDKGERETAEDFTVDIIDGEKFTLSQMRGDKFVIIDLWATWCDYCILSMPHMQALQNRFPEDIVVLAVNCGEKEETVRAFMEQSGYDFQFCLDPDSDFLNNRFPAEGIPHTIIIDKQGRIAMIDSGFKWNGYGVYMKIFDQLIMEED